MNKEQGPTPGDYRDARGPEWRAIFDTLRDYRLSNMTYEGTSDEFYPLVDLMSNEGQGIDTGEMQMVELADEISLAVKTARRSSDEQVEVVGHTANCCNCGRIIDTREEAEGGDKFGAESSDGRWLCSMECWDAVFRDEGPYAASAASGVRVIDEVAAERRRQIEKGYDATHDDMHTEGEIARAAAVYAAGGGIFKVSALQVPQQVWPYRWEYKPGDQRTNYVHAAAMLVAEIERLDRLSAIVEQP